MNVFERCREQGRAALVAYLMAGDPELEQTEEVALACAAGGADVLEIGFPYSDPLADGPTIAAAARRALDSGATFDGVLRLAARLANATPGVPLFAFSYYNPIFVRGIEKSARQLADAGFAGAIVPDLPPEEADGLPSALKRAGLSSVFLVSPTTPLARAKAISQRCGDFVYVVSRTGVTGATVGIEAAARTAVRRLRAITAKPLAVGFGVSTTEDAQAIARHADGVVVGSALVERVAAGTSAAERRSAAEEFCRDLSGALRVTR